MNTHRSVCYICGSSEDLTRDHIPPKGFFKPLLPTNMITVECCHNCHKQFSLDDEAFRVWISSLKGRSDVGQWIWKNKVMNSSFNRNPKLKQNFISLLLTHSTIDELKSDLDSPSSIPIDRANKFLTRMTKGLIYYFYKDLSYTDATFKISHLDNYSHEYQDEFNMVLSNLQYDVRGDNTFEFWRYLATNAIDFEMLWVYRFYRSAIFLVDARIIKQK